MLHIYCNKLSKATIFDQSNKLSKDISVKQTKIQHRLVEFKILEK